MLLFTDHQHTTSCLLVLFVSYLVYLFEVHLSPGRRLPRQFSSMKTPRSKKTPWKKTPRSEKIPRKKTPRSEKTPQESIPQTEFNLVWIQLQEVGNQLQELINAQGGTLPFAKKIEAGLFEVVSSLTMVASKIPCPPARLCLQDRDLQQCASADLVQRSNFQEGYATSYSGGFSQTSKRLGCHHA